jgi:hypothetical protein
MTLTTRIRFCLAAPVLAGAYFYLLTYIIGSMTAHHWPIWWFDVFPSRHFGAVTWLVTLHTAAVLLAALPIGISAVIIVPNKAVLLGLVASSFATIAAISPSLAPTIWPNIWSSHPVYFVTDQIKLVVAVPFVAWILRCGSANNRLGQSRDANSVSQGEGR